MAYGEGLKRNRAGTWCWRWVVPQELSPRFAIKDIMRSLGTTNRREAAAASLPLRLAVVGLARLARQGHHVSEQEVKHVLDRAREVARRNAATELATEEFVEAHTARAAATQKLERLESHYTEALTHAVRATTLATVEATARKLGPPLSQAIGQFITERSAMQAWTPKTLTIWQTTFRLLLEGVGNPAVNTVTRADMIEFFARLQRLPSNAQKKTELKGKTFLDLVAMQGVETISGATVNQHSTRLSGFFKWALKIEEFNCTRNPADGMSVPETDSTKRMPFGTEHLKAIFSHEMWTTREFLNPHQYWLPLMGALTGMRINEICQLRLADFGKVDQVEVIRCADMSEGGRRKNENATRTVPIHPELIRLGLLRWVAELKKRREVQLFPELKEGRDGHGQGPSKWFGRYCTAVGITERAFVFHSFRHYFISRRLNLEVPPHLIGAIVGHEQGLVTTDVYWNEREFGKLIEIVSLVSLPAEVMPLLPTIEEIRFVKMRRLPPSRLGARKTRERRIADAAARRSAKLIP